MDEKKNVRSKKSETAENKVTKRSFLHLLEAHGDEGIVYTEPSLFLVQHVLWTSTSLPGLKTKGDGPEKYNP